ncbi:MAG: aspartate carbamoyltransferase regulatory subunit [Oscillospiraceae bacterium]|nr:aspartate carbamoyltransferase regulatory subunit [Oscillospiraceae bacterium]
MNIDNVQNGVVLDHIQAGKSMAIYRYLHLDALDCPVAMIQNARSAHMGKKDIIKIDTPMEIDLDVLGYLDANITVNVIRDGKLAEKKRVELPQKLVNVIRCRNPRCITTAEEQLDAIFLLSDPARHTYRCAYCDTATDKTFPDAGK